jgi:hypothetical protein
LTRIFIVFAILPAVCIRIIFRLFCDVIINIKMLERNLQDFLRQTINYRNTDLVSNQNRKILNDFFVFAHEIVIAILSILHHCIFSHIIILHYEKCQNFCGSHRFYLEIDHIRCIDKNTSPNKFNPFLCILLLHR